MGTAVTHPRILLLSRSGSANGAAVSRLLKRAQLRVVNSFDSALAALREESFDLVVCDTGDFAALQTAQFSRDPKGSAPRGFAAGGQPGNIT
jgi:hypothetical protein